MSNIKVKYPLKYLKAADGKRLHIETYPCWGPGANVTGLRKLYNMNDAFLVKCGQYIYKVDSNIYCQAY